MWFIKSKFVGDQETFTEELENATNEQFAEMKYKRRVDEWYDLITKYYLLDIHDDKQLRLRIIEIIL